MNVSFQEANYPATHFQNWRIFMKFFIFGPVILLKIPIV